MPGVIELGQRSPDGPTRHRMVVARLGLAAKLEVMMLLRQISVFGSIVASTEMKDRCQVLQYSIGVIFSAIAGRKLIGRRLVLTHPSSDTS